MKISKLIRALQYIKGVDGDVEVTFDYVYDTAESYVLADGETGLKSPLWSEILLDSGTAYSGLSESTVNSIADSPVPVITNRGIIDLRDPEDDYLICVYQTAKILSSKYRWDSNTDRPISVARHLCVSALLAPDKFKKEAFIHDFSEAYMGDLARPIKAVCPEYIDLENIIAKAINRKYGLPEAMSSEVKAIDNYVQKLESQYVVSSKSTHILLKNKFERLEEICVPNTEASDRIAKAIGNTLYPLYTNIEKDNQLFIDVWEIVKDM